MTNLHVPQLDFIQKYASVLDEVLKAVTIKITIFCITMKCITHHKTNDVSEQSVASTFTVEEMCNNQFSKHVKLSAQLYVAS